MKYISNYNPLSINDFERIRNSNKKYPFERTFKFDDKKILNIIDMLNVKKINFELYYLYNNNFKTTLIKIYGKSKKTKTLKKLGFNILPDDYTFTWDWKPIETDINTFIKSTEYNL